MTPRRPSTLMRMGNAVTGLPEYGRTDTCPGTNVCCPGCVSGWEINVSHPEALNTIRSSAPLMEMRVRKSTGCWPGPNEAAPGKPSAILQALIGKLGNGTKSGAG